MKDVYLDDERETPAGWHRCYHVHEVVKLIKANEVRRLSLDHDLGDGEKTGYHLVLWMVENGRWPREKPLVHSANPVGAYAMRQLINEWFGRSWKEENCDHADAHPGADAPRQWGSFRTEVCDYCGAFRFHDHHGAIRSGWKPAREYAEATGPADDS